MNTAYILDSFTRCNAQEHFFQRRIQRTEFKYRPAALGHHEENIGPDIIACLRRQRDLNTAHFSGAVQNFGGNLSITSSTFTGNRATSAGIGGVTYNEQYANIIDLTYNTFSSNIGDVIFNYGTINNIQSNTFSANTSGGIRNGKYK